MAFLNDRRFRAWVNDCLLGLTFLLRLLFLDLRRTGLRVLFYF